VLSIVGPNTVAIAAGTPMTLELESTCRQTGAGTGIIRFDARWKIDGVLNNPDNGNTVTTADTTAAQDINVTFTWNENNVADTLSITQGRCLCIDPAR
jgi:hypothetical protein